MASTLVHRAMRSAFVGSQLRIGPWRGCASVTPKSTDVVSAGATHDVSLQSWDEWEKGVSSKFDTSLHCNDNSTSKDKEAVICRSFPCSNVKSCLCFKSPETIRKFNLNRHIYRKKELTAFNVCVRNAMKHRIRELVLRVHASPTFNIELPQSIYLCKTLEFLKLLPSCFSYSPKPAGSFPSLKVVDINLCRPDSCQVGQLLSNCPVLQHLRILFYYFHGSLRISAPELKTLSIDICSISSNMEWAGCDDVYFDVPKLENLVIGASVSNFVKYIFEDSKSLVRAKIDISSSAYPISSSAYHDPKYSEYAASLLEGVSAVQYLALSAPNLGGCSLPYFTRLKQLKLQLYYWTYWEIAMEFLVQAPELEELVLNINVHKWYDDEVDLFEPSKLFKPFKPPETVPLCVLSQLQTVSITNFVGSDDEFDVVKYFLNHGKHLKKITISTCDVLLCKTYTAGMTKENLKRKMSEYQKCSESCEVEIEYKVFSRKKIHYRPANVVSHSVLPPECRAN